MKSAEVLLIFILLYVCHSSIGQRYSPLCNHPNDRSRHYRIGDRFTSRKTYTGRNGRQLVGMSNCNCLSGGRTRCVAYDIPCEDDEGNFFDMNEKLKKNLGGRNWECTCKRGLARYENCVPDSASGSSGNTDVVNNPCESGLSNCHRDATCTYLGGRRYRCQCKPGFQGNGRDCQAGCRDARSRDVVPVGSQYSVRDQRSGALFECECGADGQFVRDTCVSTATACIDSISRTPVAEGGRYVVLSQSRRYYWCTCGPNGRHVPGSCGPYTGPTESMTTTTGTTTTTTTPVSDPCQGAHRCHYNADCFNRGRGRYNCVCKTGFAGSGFQCSDVNECSRPRYYPGRPRCGDHAVCTNTIGSFTCSCEDGYTGDGRTCTSTAAPSPVRCYRGRYSEGERYTVRSRSRVLNCVCVRKDGQRRGVGRCTSSRRT